jgi:hypothetical protein
MRLRFLMLATLLVTAPAAGVAQTPDLSGTWKLDVERSRPPAGPALAGLISAGAPAVLHITQPANGTLTVESQINESHARLYVPRGTTTTPVFVGQSGTITMATRWEGRTLIAEGRLQSASGVVTPVKEVFTLGADRQTLRIDVTVGDGGSASTLTYTRLSDVGPCQSWPTPCKRSP